MQRFCPMPLAAYADLFSVPDAKRGINVSSAAFAACDSARDMILTQLFVIIKPNSRRQSNSTS